jgi:hypothetical protein
VRCNFVRCLRGMHDKHTLGQAASTLGRTTLLIFESDLHYKAHCKSFYSHASSCWFLVCYTNTQLGLSSAVISFDACEVGMKSMSRGQAASSDNHFELVEKSDLNGMQS